MINGKGMYLHKAWVCEDGDPAKIAAASKAAGLSHVIFKVADGTVVYNSAYSVPLIAELRKVGIDVWGFQYFYAYSSTLEAQRAAERIKTLGLDGFVINAEKELRDHPNRYAIAKQYIATLRANIPSGFPLALSSYRYPSYHPQFPWLEMLAGVDLNMPQVYWMQATNAGAQLRRCVDEFNRMIIRRPIVPTGSAFSEWGWVAKPAEVKEFMQTTRDLNLTGCNFWEWRYARHIIPELWQEVSAFAWPFLDDVQPAPAPDWPRVVVSARGDSRPIRYGPTTMASLHGNLPPQLRVLAYYEKTVNGDVWLRLTPDGEREIWTARLYNGYELMRFVE